MKGNITFLRPAIISVAILLAALPRTGNSEMINVPGTVVTIEPPAGFVLTPQFSGFIYPGDSSSIEVAELSAEAFAEVASIFENVQAARDAFVAEGVGVHDLVKVNVGDSEVPVVMGVQMLNGTSLTKYICLFRGEKTVLLFVNIFDSTLFDKEKILNSIKSVRLTSAPSMAEKVDQLPFVFQLSGPFKVYEVLSGNTVLLTTTDSIDPSGQLPIVAIGTSLLQVSTPDIAALSTELLLGLKDFGLEEINSEGPAEFAGGNGYFAQGIHQGMTVVQFIRILPDNFYIRLLAKGDTEMLGSSMLDVMEIARSVRPRDLKQ